MPRQRRAGDERLDRRARLVRIGQRPIAPNRRRGIIQILRIERRPIRQRQHRAGVRVHDDHFAALGIEFRAGVGQFLLGDHLHVRVDRQHQMLPVLRRKIILRRNCHRSSHRIFQHALISIVPGQQLLESQFQPLQSLSVFPRSPQQMRRQAAHRVITNVGRNHADPRQIHFLDRIDRRRVQILRDLHESALRSIAQHLTDLIRIAVDDLRQRRDPIVHLHQAAAVFLKRILHEFRIDV